MRTPPRGYLAALIGSVLGSGLLAWASAWFILATDDRSAVIAGPGLALFFAIHGYGWLGVGLGCWLALLVRRAHAIGWTVVLMMLLSPIVATLHGTVSLAALRATRGGAPYPWSRALHWSTLLVTIGVLSLMVRWIALWLAGRRARNQPNASR